MRVPMDWLGEYVELPNDVTPESVHEALVRVGLEEEGIHGGELQGPIVVGRVLDFVEEPQKNGKVIRWCQVDTGDAEPRGIVCGASNFERDDLVVVSLPGAVLPGDFTIAARKTYGHISDGMMASSRELGLGDEHDGILRLRELGLSGTPGEDALSLLGLDAVAVEINVTPDRGYVLSMRGVAREYANSTGAAFTDPAARFGVVSPSGFPLSLEDSAPVRGVVGCERFVARVVRGIDPTRESPRWMQNRLRLAGIRSISVAVDITNYVMLELGAPIHGYDLAKLNGGITVRRANPGEKLTTLDGTERTLHPEDLVIADDSGAIGLAGVMGGLHTEITEATTDVLIEAAVFGPVSVARTARRHKLPSEASKRFERSVDPLVIDAAAARVAELLVEHAGGTLDETFGARVFAEFEARSIALPHGSVQALTGGDYTDAEIEAALVAIGATIESNLEALVATVPSWRPDLHTKQDLIEEAARIVGYDRIPSILPVAPPGRGFTPEQSARRRLANTLAANGLTEVLVYPFVTAAQRDLIGSPAVKLENPLDGERPFLRTSMVPGLLETAQRNRSRGLTDVAIFEIGKIYLPFALHGTEEVPSGIVRPSAEKLRELENVPAQPTMVGALFVGNRVSKQPAQQAEPFALGDALDAVDRIALALGVDLTVKQSSQAWAHPGRCAEVSLNGVAVGYAAELLPSVAEAADISQRVIVVEIDLDAVFANSSGTRETAPLTVFPAATQDLSVTVNRDIPAGAVLEAVRTGAGVLLEHISLVDDYRGQGLDDSEKSLTFALRFRAPDRTLTAAEASEAKLSGLAAATEAFGAKLRA